MDSVQASREADASLSGEVSKGVKAPLEDMEDPADAASSTPGLSCLHLLWTCSSSQAAGCFRE